MRHSYSGYLAAIQVRSSRTLLVEGTDDKTVLSRVVAEASATGSEKVVIDTAEMIKPPSPAGNREIVEGVHALARGQGLRLAAWVDREFREFEFTHSVGDPLGIHKIQFVTLFWTRGHSIENYFFFAKRVTRFLKYKFIDRLPDGWEQALAASFPDILAWAASLSVAAFENSILQRMGDMFTEASWHVGAKCEPDWTQVGAALQQRGVAAAVVNTVETRARTLFGQFFPSELTIAQWACHGHIGESCVWSAAAALLGSLGADKRLVSDVSNGFKDEKLRHAAEVWAAEIAASSGEVPSTLVTWLSAHPCPMP